MFNGKRIDLISVYCPRGNADIVEIRALFNSITNEAIIGGDFNAHHPLWGRSSQPNKADRSLFEYLNDSNLLLCTPPKLETRIAPGSAAPSNLDLTFASLACDLSISLGSDWDSDHISLLLYFDFVFSPTDPGPPSKWVFRDRSWPLWNASIESSLQPSQFFSLNDPELANSHFNQAIISARISASSEYFSPVSSSHRFREPAHPWWTPDCKKAVALYRRARPRSRWISPCTSQSIELKRIEAIKKRTILQAKKASWSTHLSSLSLTSQPKKLWRFCTSMLGSSSASSHSSLFPLKERDGLCLLDSVDKASLLLDTFCPPTSAPTVNDPVDMELISFIILSLTHVSLIQITHLNSETRLLTQNYALL